MENKEWRDKKGVFVKGHGCSPETRAKISATKKAHPHSHPCWSKGLSKETDERIARAAAEKTGKRIGPRPKRKGIRVSISTEFKKGLHPAVATEFKSGEFAKEKHPLWKGGVTPHNDLLRKSSDYRAWRNKVYRRDHYLCQDCGVHCESTNIIAHHLKEFADYPELRFEVDNGLTLCRTCHFNRHHHKEAPCRLVA